MQWGRGKGDLWCDFWGRVDVNIFCVCSNWWCSTAPWEERDWINIYYTAAALKNSVMSNTPTGGVGGRRGWTKKKLVMTLNLHMSDILSVRRQYIFWRQSFCILLKLFHMTPMVLLCGFIIIGCGRMPELGGGDAVHIISSFVTTWCFFFTHQLIIFLHIHFSITISLNHRVQRNTNLHWNTWRWIRLPSLTSTLRTRTCQILLLFKPWQAIHGRRYCRCRYCY